jgi:hypothetical protein
MPPDYADDAAKHMSFSLIPLINKSRVNVVLIPESNAAAWGDIGKMHNVK